MKKEFLQTLHRIIQTGHWITDQVSKELKNYDITEPQYNVLRTLMMAGESPLTVQEIQKSMIQKNSNVSRIIDKLLSKGYVNRLICPSNRRKMDITLTVQGKEMLTVLDKKVYALYDPMHHRLETKELLELEKLITKLTTNHHE